MNKANETEIIIKAIKLDTLTKLFKQKKKYFKLILVFKSIISVHKTLSFLQSL